MRFLVSFISYICAYRGQLAGLWFVLRKKRKKRLADERSYCVAQSPCLLQYS